MKRSLSPSIEPDGSPPRKIHRTFTTEEFTTALKTNNLPAVQAMLSANPTLLETTLRVHLPHWGFEIDATPLVVATTFGCLEVVEFLVENKADVHAKNDAALRFSAEYGHLEVVKFLVENGADVHAENDAALRWSAEYGHLEVVKFLVENKADVHTLNDCALLLSARNGHLEVVKFLVKNEAVVHTRNNFALRWAARNGHLGVVKFLVKNGADVQAQDNEALRLSAEKNHLAVFAFLLQYYTEVEIQNLSINAVQQACQQHAQEEYVLVQSVWSDIAKLAENSANMADQSVLDSNSPLPLVVLQAVALRECEITLTIFQQ